MHINFLYKLLTNKSLKPAYYFDFSMDTGELSIKVLEFHRKTGIVARLSIYPYRYFKNSKEALKSALITKSKYNLLLKKLKAIK